MVACLLVASCGSEDDEDEVQGVTCESNCERMAKANCSQLPVTAQEDCAAACAQSRAQVPEQCVDELAAAHSCVATKVKFSCDSRGFVVKSPAPGAACEKEAAACTACSGDVTICNRLGG